MELKLRHGKHKKHSVKKNQIEKSIWGRKKKNRKKIVNIGGGKWWTGKNSTAHY